MCKSTPLRVRSSTPLRVMASIPDSHTLQGCLFVDLRAYQELQIAVDEQSPPAALYVNAWATYHAVLLRLLVPTRKTWEAQCVKRVAGPSLGRRRPKLHRTLCPSLTLEAIQLAFYWCVEVHSGRLRAVSKEWHHTSCGVLSKCSLDTSHSFRCRTVMVMLDFLAK